MREETTSFWRCDWVACKSCPCAPTCLRLTSSGSYPTVRACDLPTVPPRSDLTAQEGLAGVAESERFEKPWFHLNSRSVGRRGRSWEERVQPRARDPVRRYF